MHFDKIQISEIYLFAFVKHILTVHSHICSILIFRFIKMNFIILWLTNMVHTHIVIRLGLSDKT